MSTEIVKKEMSEEVKKLAGEYLSSMGMKLPAKTQNMFINLAASFGLNPFKREILCVGYGENFSVITGYETYIKRAERTAKMDGWQCEFEGVENLDKPYQAKAKMTIFRKDWSRPFTHEVYYTEVVQRNKDGRPNQAWAKMPVFMTKKVCMAQAFRLCFPDEFAGMPYTQDEMPEGEVIETKAEVVESKVAAPQQPTNQVVNTATATATATATSSDNPPQNRINAFLIYINNLDFLTAAKCLKNMKADYPNFDFSRYEKYGATMKQDFSEYADMVDNGLFEKASEFLAQLKAEHPKQKYDRWEEYQPSTSTPEPSK